MKETHHSFCRICEALCGLEIEVKHGKITSIKPDQKHVATRGFGCAKGLKQERLLGSPDRLMYPMRRDGDDWSRVSWDQAMQGIGSEVKRIRKQYGPDSIGMYVGTAAGFSVLHPVFAQGFMTGIGSKSMYASATQDCSNKFAVSNEMYGFPFTQPFPDLERTSCLIIVGANPVISKWSFLQVSNPGRHLKEIEARGGKIYIVDPRETETAKVAGEHVFVRPGTDVFFFLSFLHTLIEIGGVSEEHVETYATGFAEVAALAKAWSPERTAEVTRIPASTLRKIVRDYHEAEGAAIYSSTGVNMGGHGALAFWLQEVINLCSGNLDREGGTLVGQGVIDFPRFGKKNGVLVRKDRSRIGNLPSVNDAFPGGVLADEILTPGDRQLRALFVTGGNPLITMANSERLREAFSQLELLVVLDIFPNETASLAHYTLPCVSPMQRPDLPFIFPLMLGLQTKPYLQATKRVVPPQGEQRDEASIYFDLCQASGVGIFGSKIAQGMLGLMKWWYSRRHPQEQPGLPQETLLSLILRLTRQGSFRQLLKHPHGRLQKAHQASAFLGKRVLTDDRKVKLAPTSLLDYAKTLEPSFAREQADHDVLKLITKRAITTHNSWTHNFEEFVAGRRSTNYLYMHPDDGARCGVEDGALADVSSKTATLRVPVKWLSTLMPGTVALPHGWGHQAAKGLRVASQTKGVNVNILAADGVENIEPLSGMSKLTGIVVEVSPAAGPQDFGHWSGLPAQER